jgi:hypothetical protein
MNRFLVLSFSDVILMPIIALRGAPKNTYLIKKEAG